MVRCMGRAVAFAGAYWLFVFLAVEQVFRFMGRVAGYGPEHWQGLIVLFALQVMLLIAPSRPGALLLTPLLASGLLLGFLLFSFEMAVGEYARLLSDTSIWTMIVPAVAAIGYVFLMHREGRRLGAKELLRRQRWILLIAGILVLLVTIPAHVQTVKRGAFSGIGTALGLIASVLIILFALGQLLFARMLPPSPRASTTDGI
jgi:hypothetical protein